MREIATRDSRDMEAWTLMIMIIRPVGHVATTASRDVMIMINSHLLTW